MRRIVNINISKSIKSKKLIFAEDWTEKFDQFAVYFFCLTGIFISSSVYRQKLQPNDEFIKYVIPFGILFFFYLIYRKAIEKKLLQIDTSFDSETNRKLLIRFAEKSGYEIHRNSNQCLIFNESISYSSRVKSAVFLVKDNKVYFTKLQQGFRLNLPILFSQITLRKDLKNYFETARDEQTLASL